MLTALNVVANLTPRLTSCAALAGAVVEITVDRARLGVQSAQAFDAATHEGS